MYTLAKKYWRLENSVFCKTARRCGVTSLNRVEYHHPTIDAQLKFFLISLGMLVVLLLQYQFQFVDNNRLLSWQWAMSRSHLLTVMLMSVAGFVAVYQFIHVRISHRLAVAAIVAGSYFIGVLTWSLPEYMVDSARYFGHAKMIASQGVVNFLTQWGGDVNAWTDLPLASMVYGLLFSLFGESRIAIQVINTGFFSASVLLTYLIGKTLWYEATGIYAALMLLCIPFLIVQPSQLLVDIPAMFFVTLALFTCIKALQLGKVAWMIAAVISIIAGMLTKYAAWVALCSVLVLPVALRVKHGVAIRRRFSIIAALCTVFAAIILYGYHEVLIKQFDLIWGYQLPAFGRWQESYVSTFFYQMHPLISVAALASVVIAIKKKDINYLIPAIALAAMFVIGVIRARYLVTVFPMLALMSAFAVQEIKDDLIKKYLIGTALAISIIITFVVNVGFLQSTSVVNLQSAGDYLNTLEEQNTAVLVLPQPNTAVNPAITVPMLDYYSDKKLFLLPGTFAKVSSDDASVMRLSALRFTWEVQPLNYQFMERSQLNSDTAIAVVSAVNTGVPPQGYAEIFEGFVLSKRFSITDPVFKFQTIVDIYQHKEHAAVKNKVNIGRYQYNRRAVS